MNPGGVYDDMDGYSSNLYPGSYANGAFYDDDQDIYVARTSPPSSPDADKNSNGMLVGNLDFSSAMDEENSTNAFLEELNMGRRNIYDILSQRVAYDVLPDSQKLLVFNTNTPLDLVFQSLRRQEAVEGVIWDAETATYQGVITSSDLLICLNRQYELYKNSQNVGTPVPLPRLLDKDIKSYRETIYPNSQHLAYGIPNNSLFQILKLMFDCHVHRIPIIDRVNEGNLIGVINYLDILHYLVTYYPEYLHNYSLSIQDLAIGNYDKIWNVRESTPLHEVLHIMENKVISSVPVIDDNCNLIGIFQRTDLIKLDFKDMSIFDYPISTFITSFQPFSSDLVIKEEESLSHLFFTFAVQNTTSLVCVDTNNKPCGVVSIVDLFLFFLKGDFSMTPRLSAPPSVRERPSYSQSLLSPIFSPMGSGSFTDYSAGDFCMNFPETIVQPRVSSTTREELETETYDEDFERMKGHVYGESAYRERNDGGMGDRFVSKKRTLE